MYNLCAQMLIRSLCYIYRLLTQSLITVTRGVTRLTAETAVSAAFDNTLVRLCPPYPTTTDKRRHRHHLFSAVATNNTEVYRVACKMSSNTKSTRLDLFVKEKRQTITVVLPLGIKYSMFDVVCD